jgi:hypothetical protein
LLQIGEAAVLRNSRHSVRGQNRKLTKVDCFGALRLQVVVQERVMADLVVGVVINDRARLKAMLLS